MLCLSRNPNETIVINGGQPDEIRVKVLGWNGSKVKLGIDAPKDVSIHRLEVFNRLELKDGGEQSNSELLHGD